MRPGNVYWAFVFGFGVIFVACGAIADSKQQNVNEKSGSSTYNSFGDDIYLDEQDGLEGSGRGGGEVRDDLEASGSGLGPDDEDGDDDELGKHNTAEPAVDKPTQPKVPSTEDKIYKNKEASVDDINGPEGGVKVVEPVDTEDINQDNRDDTVYIMNPKHEERANSFFAQPGVLAAVIGGAVVGLLCAILVVMFIVYRMRKKDEGSYALDEPRRSPVAHTFSKSGISHHNREFYA